MIHYKTLRLLVILLALCCPYLKSALPKSLKLKDKLGKVHATIEYINSLPENTWKAGLAFDGETTLNDVVNSRLGLKNRKHYSKSTVKSNRLIYPDNDNFTVPDTYDIRKVYPNCVSTAAVKDQANCGSCWAVSIASALSDRFCIQSNGKIAVNLSANYFTACSNENDGCQGGYMDESHDFLVTDGLITGGDYESDEGCQPYEIRPCGFYDTLPCASSLALTPKCKQNICSNEYHNMAYEDNTYKAAKYYALPVNELEIRKEIFRNGPVTASFIVYIDFLWYKSGIYRKTSDYELGGHAVKIIGWGEEAGVKYWLVSNSWSSRWGENGLFRIIRGRNECEFEEDVHAATPFLG